MHKLNVFAFKDRCALKQSIAERSSSEPSSSKYARFQVLKIAAIAIVLKSCIVVSYKQFASCR